MTQDGAIDPALAALPLGVWVIGPDSRLVFANAATRLVTGIDPAETPPGLPVAELVRRLAYRGLYGEGDPEALATEHWRSIAAAPSAVNSAAPTAPASSRSARPWPTAAMSPR